MRRTAVTSIMAAAGIGLAIGCQPATNTFDLINYRDDGGTERFQQQFDECFYSINADGNIDLVARRNSRGLGDERQDVMQIIHVRTLYRAVPGRTAVDRTMINAWITYAIVSDTGGVCFEGGGFLTGAEKSGKTVLTGELEDAKLHPRRSVGEAPNIFDRAQVTGRFTARRDRGRVVGVLNDIDRLFGPRPRYEPPPTGAPDPS